MTQKEATAIINAMRGKSWSQAVEIDLNYAMAPLICDSDIRPDPPTPTRNNIAAEFDEIRTRIAAIEEAIDNYGDREVTRLDNIESRERGNNSFLVTVRQHMKNVDDQMGLVLDRLAALEKKTSAWTDLAAKRDAVIEAAKGWVNYCISDNGAFSLHEARTCRDAVRALSDTEAAK